MLVDNLSSSITQSLSPLLEGAQRICLIDPPGHPNVGDSAILLGELDFLRRNHPQAEVTFVDVSDYGDGAFDTVAAADVLLIHGGGNFGDIWMHHHNVRLWALKNFPSMRIIQLPQSIHFSDRDILAETASAIGRQADFHLFVRDHRSRDFAEQNLTSRVKLVPDMAFAMNPISPSRGRLDAYCLLRTDKERAADHASIKGALQSVGYKYQIGDWLDERPSLTSRADALATKARRRIPRISRELAGPLLGLRRRYAEKRLAFGIGLLSRGKAVVADRLHAHIISCLLGLPNVVFDSYDGKISALYETWTHQFSIAAVCPDANQLAPLLEQVTRGRP